MTGDDDEITGVFSEPTEEELSAADRARVIAGRYEIMERIGEGGMGQVLRVAHRRLGKAFALKLMQAEFSLDPESREIFHREARLASGLTHPNIVSIVDFGEDPDWGLFIVMEYIEGEPLAQRIEEHGALPVPVVCDVVTQLVDALHHSHSHGVVHGDLKPDNVLCVNSEGDERRKWTVKLLDYGMARPISPGAGRQDRVAGTPEYIAPERITGGPLLPPADIYALGVMMYEMLSGAPPFGGDGPTKILERHLREPPPPLRGPGDQPIEPGMVSIVERALAKEPASRFADALELGRALRDVMDGMGLVRRSGTRRPGTAPGDTRNDAAADAFDALGIPAVGLSTDGVIVVANHKFCRLLRCGQPDELEGTSVLDTPLAQASPELREDLRQVAMTGRVVRRRLAFRTGETAHALRMLMTPASGRCGSCVLVLHPLPRRG